MSATKKRINGYLLSIGAELDNSTNRPTEAQLKWAIFHRAQLVRSTKAKIERLMHFPLDVKDVEGARLSDGDSTDCSVGDVDEHGEHYEHDGKGVCLDEVDYNFDMSPEQLMQHAHSLSQLAQSLPTNNKQSYLGTRRDPKTGKWVRRHFSQKRFPHLATKYSRHLPQHEQHQPQHTPLQHQSQQQQQRLQQQNQRQKTHIAQTSPHAGRYFEHRKKTNVRISKGRRALIRVSARTLEERKLNNNAKHPQHSPHVPSSRQVHDGHSPLRKMSTTSPHDSYVSSRSPSRPSFMPWDPGLVDPVSDWSRPGSVPVDSSFSDEATRSCYEPCGNSDQTPKRSNKSRNAIIANRNDNNSSNEITKISSTNSIMNNGGSNVTSDTKSKSHRKRKSKTKVIFENVSDIDSLHSVHHMHPTEMEPTNPTFTMEDEISNLFTVQTGDTSKGRSTRSKQNRGRNQDSISNEDEERIRRFHQAYMAIILASSSPHTDDEATVATISSEWIKTGGKRWSRDPSVSSAISVDGRQYEDLQRTSTVSLKQIRRMVGSEECYDLRNRNGGVGMEICDRGASWLVHVPKGWRKDSMNVMNGMYSTNGAEAMNGLRDEDFGDDEFLTSSQDGIAMQSDMEQAVGEWRGRNRERDTNPRNILLSPSQKKLEEIESKFQGKNRDEKLDLMKKNRMSIAQSVFNVENTSAVSYQITRLASDATKDIPPLDSSSSVLGKCNNLTRKGANNPQVPSGSQERRQFQINKINNRSRNLSLEAKGILISKPIVSSSSECSLECRKENGAGAHERAKQVLPKPSDPLIDQHGYSRPLMVGADSNAPNEHCRSSNDENARKVGTTTKISHDKIAPLNSTNQITLNQETNLKSINSGNTLGVRTSTLRKLFSGIHNGPKQAMSQTNNVAKNTKQRIDHVADTSSSDTTPTFDIDVPISRPSSVPCSPKHYQSVLPHVKTKVLNGVEGLSLNDEGTTERHIIDIASSNGKGNDSHPEDQLADHSSVSKSSVVKEGELINFRRDINKHSKIEDQSSSSSESVDMVSLQNLNVAKLVRESLALHRTKSIIDTDGSDIGLDEEEVVSRTFQSMLMSPSLITKRFHQALNVIEIRNWDQLSYLIHANPWLMEMKDVRNDQFLIHPLALFGGGQNKEVEESFADSNSVPKKLIEDIISHNPVCVQKLDTEGNLPLHMAAASANVDMIRELGKHFPGAASVQNHDGMLPLHLAIMSCAVFPSGVEAVEIIVEMFPGAVFIKDNEGNMPLHVSAGILKGDMGVDVIYHLVRVWSELIESHPAFVKEKDDEASVETATTEITSDLSAKDDTFLSTAKNNDGESPLFRAIKSLAGWQVVEALLNVVGGHAAALERNSSNQNALHVALQSDYNDAAVVLSILKSIPSIANITNGEGILPIQLACMNSLQHEIILAIAIIDLPIDLGTKEEAIIRDGFGASWWFLLCESDDQYVAVVKEVLSLCSHSQKMALCLTTAGNTMDGSSVIRSSSPLCKLELRRSLRFLGRFEFVSMDQELLKGSQSVQEFNGIDVDAGENGRKVILRCYTDRNDYETDTRHLKHSNLDPRFVEDMQYFCVDETEANVPQGFPIHYCVSISISKMTLSRIVAGMPSNHKYREDLNLLNRYYRKAKSVLRQVAEALWHIHKAGIIHGCIDSHHVGKVDNDWKITGLLGSAANGDTFSPKRLGLHSPPETYVKQSCFGCNNPSESFQNNMLLLKAEPSVDIWAFGKLMYEVLLGESLFNIIPNYNSVEETYVYISRWNRKSLKLVSDTLLHAGIGSTGVGLVCNCLSPRKEERPHSMSVVFRHSFWTEDHLV